jgi:hypothetical protein
MAWRIANEIAAALERWVERKEKRSVRLCFKKSDQLSLLKLRTWSFRYHLSIVDILDMILPVLRGQVKVKKKTYGLGVAVRSLVGPGAERVLVEEIKRRYPNGEHIAMWREQERERQLEAERLLESDGLVPREYTENLVTADSTEKFVTEYTRRTLAKRADNRSNRANRSRRRKKYRGNPW